MEKSNEHSIALHHCWTELSIFLAEDSLITVQTTFPSTMVYIVGHVSTLSYVTLKQSVPCSKQNLDPEEFIQ